MQTCIYRDWNTDTYSHKHIPHTLVTHFVNYLLSSPLIFSVSPFMCMFEDIFCAQHWPSDTRQNHHVPDIILSRAGFYKAIVQGRERQRERERERERKINREKGRGRGREGEREWESESRAGLYKALVQGHVWCSPVWTHLPLLSWGRRLFCLVSDYYCWSLRMS